MFIVSPPRQPPHTPILCYTLCYPPSHAYTRCIHTRHTPRTLQATWDVVQDATTSVTKWGALGDWDVSVVGDFSYAFSTGRNEAGDSAADGNPKAATFVGTGLDKWNTSSVTTLFNTFRNAGEMNSDLSKWSVAKVTSLLHTFRAASKFVGTGLGSWDTSSVTTLHYTFNGAGEMNSDLSKWSVAKVTTLHGTFHSASNFAGTGLDSWNTASVTTLSNTFFLASEMNSDLSIWNVAKVVSLLSTFKSASKFAGVGLDAWDVANVTQMAGTFTATTSLTTCNKRKIADAWKSSATFTGTTYDTDWAGEICPKVRDEVGTIGCDRRCLVVYGV